MCQWPASQLNKGVRAVLVIGKVVERRYLDSVILHLFFEQLLFSIYAESKSICGRITFILRRKQSMGTKFF